MRNLRFDFGELSRAAICDLRLKDERAPKRVTRFGPSIANRKSQIANPKAFTLIEAVTSTLIVGILLSAALTAASSSAVAQYHASDRARGRFLGEALMSEILSQQYIDPGSSPTFGPEVGEATSPASRVNFNDVDDYNNWTESPPQNKDGTVIPNFTGWTRTVSVCWVSPADLTTPVLTSDTNVKRITVTVLHTRVPVATSVGVKSNHP